MDMCQFVRCHCVYILSNDNHGYLFLRTEEFFCLLYDVKSIVSQPETVLHLT